MSEKTYFYFKKAREIEVDFNLHLINSLAELKNILSSIPEVKYIAFDIETSGLNPEVDSIVGFSFAFNSNEGFYYPILSSSICLPIEGLNSFISFVKERNIILIVYNALFDILFLKEKGIVSKEFNSFYDCQVLVWLMDTNVHMPALKWASEYYLGIKSPTFTEAFGGIQDISSLPAELQYKYAAKDSVLTLLLFNNFFNSCLQEQEFITKLDLNFVQVLTNLIYENKYKVDFSVLKRIEQKIQERSSVLEKEIFEEVGIAFNIGSSQQVASVLASMGYDTGVRTKTGKMSVRADFLETLDIPIAKKISEYNSLRKLLSSYVNVLAQAPKEGFRVLYQPCNVPTGRLSSGASSKKDNYFLHFNIQSVVKDEAKLYYVHSDPKEEQEGIHILGYTFNDNEEGSIGKCEGMAQDFNLRSCFIPEPNSYWVSIDYSSEELRIMALFSREPVFLEAFQKGEDLHKKTAIAIWGEKEYNKDKRKLAKICNFSLQYGGTAYTLETKLRVSKEEAEKIYNDYNNSLKVLTKWKKEQIKQASISGVVRTLFGRVRRVAPLFQDNFGYGARTALNSPIQGTGGDIIRLALVRLYKNVFSCNPRVKFMNTVHDEINFSVAKTEFFKEDIKTLVELMTIKNFDIPIEVEVSIGTSWGTIFPFVFDKDGNLIPKFEI